MIVTRVKDEKGQDRNTRVSGDPEKTDREPVPSQLINEDKEAFKK